MQVACGLRGGHTNLIARDGQTLRLRCIDCLRETRGIRVP
jgi:hypothetical protein